VRGLLPLLGDLLPVPPGVAGDDWHGRAAAFVPPVLPETPAFQEALDRARDLVRAEAPHEAWTVLKAALPSWDPGPTDRIAPVILLADPELGPLMTPDRAGAVLTTPRGRAVG